MKLKNVLSLQPESEKAEQSAFIQNKKNYSLEFFNQSF